VLELHLHRYTVYDCVWITYGNFLGICSVLCLGFWVVLGQIIIVFSNLNKISRDFSLLSWVLFWLRIYGSRLNTFHFVFFSNLLETHVLNHRKFVLINMCQKLYELYVSVSLYFDCFYNLCLQISFCLKFEFALFTSKLWRPALELVSRYKRFQFSSISQPAHRYTRTHTQIERKRGGW